MELNENDLDNVLGGTTREVGTEQALKNEELYREKAIKKLRREEIIEELKKMRAKIDMNDLETYKIKEINTINDLAQEEDEVSFEEWDFYMRLWNAIKKSDERRRK